MRKIVLYIASSLDGYIARSNGDIDWLFTDQNYGYTKFLDSIDTVLLGRKTYDQVLTFGEYPYQEKKSYVFTKNRDFQATSDVEVVTHLESFVKDLRLLEGKNIWLVGGALLIRDFLNQNFVNEVILSVHPLILGDGIPLFANPNTTALQLTGCQTYSSGMVQLSYDVAA